MTTQDVPSGRPHGLTAALVIPTYRRHEILRRHLERWRLSDRRPDQLVVVDASPDASVEGPLIASAFADLFAGRDSAYLVASVPSISQQRNLALDRLWTDVVVFADDETDPASDYLDKLLDVYAADRAGVIGGVGGQLDDVAWRFRDGLATIFVKRFARRFSMTDAEAFPRGARLPANLAGRSLTPARNLYGNRMSFRTELAQKLRFDPLMLRYSFLEDLDLSVRVSRTHDLVIRQDALIHHEPASAARVTSTTMFLTSFINPAYVAEKLFPEGTHRRPLDRLLRLSEVTRLVMPSGWRTAARQRVRDEHAAARALIRYVRSGPPDELGRRFAAVQAYLNGPGSETGDLVDPAVIRAWIDRQRATG